MKWFKPVAATVAIGLAIGLCFDSIALAQEYVPPPMGIPGRRRGAGTRGPELCSQEPNLTALLPENSYGQTLSATPTWFWYLPETNAAEVEFVLLDREGNSVYQTTMMPPADAQIVSLTLPDTVTIAPEADYRWYFSIVCNPDDRSQDIYTEGWIRQVSPSADLTQQLNAFQADRAAILAASSLWYDALLELATAQRQQAPDADRAWRSLLESVGLGEFAAAPLSASDLVPTEASP